MVSLGQPGFTRYATSATHTHATRRVLPATLAGTQAKKVGRTNRHGPGVTATEHLVPDRVSRLSSSVSVHLRAPEPTVEALSRNDTGSFAVKDADHGGVTVADACPPPWEPSALRGTR